MEASLSPEAPEQLKVESPGRMPDQEVQVVEVEPWSLKFLCQTVNLEVDHW